MILNQIQKYWGGLRNYLGKVTSQWMKETEMGNRGSKSSVSTGRKAVHISEFVRTVVKEQRVYGGCMELNGSILRCTLMDLKKDYQNRILSKYKKKEIRYYSTPSNLPVPSRASAGMSGRFSSEKDKSLILNRIYRRWRLF